MIQIRVDYSTPPTFLQAQTSPISVFAEKTPALRKSVIGISLRAGKSALSSLAKNSALYFFLCHIRNAKLKFILHQIRKDFFGVSVIISCAKIINAV